MKNKTIYALFCTTMLIPGLAFAMQDAQETPAKAKLHKTLEEALVPPTNTPLGHQQAEKSRAVVRKLPTEAELVRQVSEEHPDMTTPVRNKFGTKLLEIKKVRAVEGALIEITEIRDAVAKQRVERDRAAQKEKELAALRTQISQKQELSAHGQEEKKALEQQVATLTEQLQNKEKELTQQIEALETENKELKSSGEVADEISTLYEAHLRDNMKALASLRSELSQTKIMLTDKALLLEIATAKIDIYQTDATLISGVQRALSPRGLAGALDQVANVAVNQAAVPTLVPAPLGVQPEVQAGAEDGDDVELPEGLN
jgi:DNA repair exonuclease SbcCD ATPase subunit